MPFLGSSAAADDFTANVSTGRCSHAPAINHVHACAARLAHLRDDVIRLVKRRERCGLRRCCGGQRKENSGQPDHCFLLLTFKTSDFLLTTRLGERLGSKAREICSSLPPSPSPPPTPATPTPTGISVSVGGTIGGIAVTSRPVTPAPARRRWLSAQS